MIVFSAHRICHGTIAPLPPRALITSMLAEIGQRMLARGPLRAGDLICEGWRLARATSRGCEFVARLTIVCEPGEMNGSLARWYEWQHPRWTWSPAPLPLELLAAPPSPVAGDGPARQIENPVALSAPDAGAIE